MKVSENKSDYLKNTYLFEHGTSKVATNSPESTSCITNKIKTILKTPIQFIPYKNSTKSLSKFNSPKNNNNKINTNEDIKNKNTKDTSLNFMYFNDLNNKIKKNELNKKYKNLIESKNNDINTLQKEIEYYKNILKNNKIHINNKIYLPKNPSDIFLSTILINKKSKKSKISTPGQSSYLYLKNSSSYAKHNNLKLLDLNEDNNRRFKPKNNLNFNNLNLLTKNQKIFGNHKIPFSNNVKIDFNRFKQKYNTLTTTSIKTNNYLINSKSCYKNKHFNSDSEGQINDLVSFSSKGDLNSIDSNDVSYTSELKRQKKFEKKIKVSNLNTNRNGNNTLYSNKNSLNNINSTSENLFLEEISDETSYNNRRYKEKFENVINRMENLLDNLFYIIYNKKEYNIIKNK